MYSTEILLLSCWLSRKPYLCFLLLLHSLIMPRGEVGTQKDFCQQFLRPPLTLQIPIGINPEELLLPSLLCSTSALKTLWWKRQSDSKASKCRGFGGGSWGAWGFHLVSSCSLMALTPYGMYCKADLTTSAAQSSWESYDMIVLDLKTLVVFIEFT